MNVIYTSRVSKSWGEFHFWVNYPFKTYLHCDIIFITVYCTMN